MERHPNNVGGGSAFFFLSLFFFFFCRLCGRVIHGQKYQGFFFFFFFFFFSFFCQSNIFFFFFFPRNFLQTETNSGKLLITVPAHLVCIKRGDRSDIRISARFPGDAPTFSLISLVTPLSPHTPPPPPPPPPPSTYRSPFPLLTCIKQSLLIIGPIIKLEYIWLPDLDPIKILECKCVILKAWYGGL